MCGVIRWYALPPERKVLEAFQTQTPLLIMGSHDWNVPNAFGEMTCGAERQLQVLEAARIRYSRRFEGPVHAM